ncbi:MAG: efflux transporter periplasmic adaptor subunit, partial [Dehalococcoidia bacterium]|nr:efflux transporter periplasmic adaptor subunit [Dehalococcoidia bacterium]
QSVLRIPAEALIKQQDGTFVFIVVGGKAKKQKIEVGAQQEGGVVVLSGLSQGDRVVVSGQAALKDGDPVRVQG